MKVVSREFLLYFYSILIIIQIPPGYSSMLIVLCPFFIVIISKIKFHSVLSSMCADIQNIQLKKGYKKVLSCALH